MLGEVFLNPKIFFENEGERNIKFDKKIIGNFSKRYLTGFFLLFYV